MSWIKDFKGHSGCKVQLYNQDNKFIIKKSGSNKLEKSAEILQLLSQQGFSTPKIYSINNEEIEMEYINGVDMRNYIYNADKTQISKLVDFINTYIERSQDFKIANISEKILDKISEIESKIDTTPLSFTLSQLYDQLPTSGRCGLIHGDLTLENILYYNDKFYLIDANPTDITSVEYDASKLLQDLDCLWFVRNEKDKIAYKITCQKISQQLKNKWDFLNNRYILIFMLLRVLPYCKDEKTKSFLTKEINNLWQS